MKSNNFYASYKISPVAFELKQRNIGQEIKIRNFRTEMKISCGELPASRLRIRNETYSVRSYFKFKN